MKKIKWLFLFVVLFQFIMACAPKNDAAPAGSAKTLNLDTYTTWRLDRESAGTHVHPDYFILVSWESTHPDPLYDIKISYSTANPEDNRATVLTSDDADAVEVDEAGLAAYKGNSIVVSDYQRDFNNGPGEIVADEKNEKVYTISIGYSDTAKYGSERVQLEVVKFFRPTTPHSEGDVMRGGGAGISGGR